MPKGIIIKGIGGFYYVKAGDQIYECKARGIFRRNEITPLPGDEVVISVIDEKRKKGALDEILPRHSLLVRPAVANISQLIVVVAAKSPQTDLLLLDKLLLSAEMKDIEVLICVNKIDLDEAKEYEAFVQIYSKSGYKTLPISTKTKQGLEGFKEALKYKTTAFAGQSGVGKSTILNTILNSWVMETGELSEKLARGKHTTRHAELIALEADGFVLDTPGFSSFELTPVPPGQLALYYPEFETFHNQCRFTGCNHINEPDCAVKKALQGGQIDEGRYLRFVQLYQTMKNHKEYGGKK